MHDVQGLTNCETIYTLALYRGIVYFIVGHLYQALHDDAVQSGAAAARGFSPVSVAIEWRR